MAEKHCGEDDQPGDHGLLSDLVLLRQVLVQLVRVGSVDDPGEPVGVVVGHGHVVADAGWDSRLADRRLADR